MNYQQRFEIAETRKRELLYSSGMEYDLIDIISCQTFFICLYSESWQNLSIVYYLIQNGGKLLRTKTRLQMLPFFRLKITAKLNASKLSERNNMDLIEVSSRFRRYSLSSLTVSME